MASLSLKRKHPSGEVVVMGSASGSYGPMGGGVGLYSPEPSPDDRRKRRNDKLSWVAYTFTPYLDGRSWRKYGEKNIKGSDFNRLYFRCSYREEQNCMATMQVQQENFDDPPLFSVVYKHEHTCHVAPVPAPDVGVVVPEVEPSAASDGGLVLRFGSTGDSHYRHCDPWLQQEQHQYDQSVPPISPLLMTSLYSCNGQLQDQKPAFLSDVPPQMAMASWSSSSFPTAIESLPSPPSTDDVGGVLSTWDWDLFRYVHLDEHVQFPGNCSVGLPSWDNDGCSLAHMITGLETEVIGNN
ncbi:hypothetical protein ACP70R_011559 [Stipagrostis hirtigluma subsp. patula]